MCGVLRCGLWMRSWFMWEKMMRVVTWRSRGERQRFVKSLRQPSTCQWSWQSRRECGAERGVEVRKPWRGEYNSAHHLKPNPLFSPLSVYCLSLSVCQLSTKLKLTSSHPFSLLCSPSHLPYPKYPSLYFLKCSLSSLPSLCPPGAPFFLLPYSLTVYEPS